MTAEDFRFGFDENNDVEYVEFIENPTKLEITSAPLQSSKSSSPIVLQNYAQLVDFTSPA